VESEEKGARVEGRDREWRGSPLDVADTGIDPRGIREFVIELDNGDSDVFRPRRREEFESYELHMMAVYLDTVASNARRKVR
jgi:hypothetical protein